MAIADVLGTIGKQAAGSLIGQVAKAVIEIEDERFAPADITVTEERRRSADSPLGAAAGQLQAAAQAVAENVPGAAGIAQLAQTAAQGAGVAPKRIFEVKFNPSEITFQATGGKCVARSNYAGAGNLKLEYTSMDARVQVRVPLIFDDYERTETFMMEKLTDPMALARMGVTSAASAITKRVHSVRPEVEGFVGALRNTHTRKLKFHWGNMCYQGVLNELSATYTMFSIEGRPVRAVVQLGFICADNNQRDGNMGQWAASYQKAFAEDYSKLESMTQNVGNLLNINL